MSFHRSTFLAATARRRLLLFSSGWISFTHLNNGPAIAVLGTDNDSFAPGGILPTGFQLAVGHVHKSRSCTKERSLGCPLRSNRLHVSRSLALAWSALLSPWYHKPFDPILAGAQFMEWYKAVVWFCAEMPPPPPNPFGEVTVHLKPVA